MQLANLATYVAGLHPINLLSLVMPLLSPQSKINCEDFIWYFFLALRSRIYELACGVTTKLKLT